MTLKENRSSFTPIGENIIHHSSWQKSTIEEQNNANDSVCITISPSQFRSLLSSTSCAVSFAREILVFISQSIRARCVLILIADEIQKYNVSVFEHKNEQTSIKVAKSLGEKIFSFFLKASEELTLNNGQDFKIIGWSDMLSSSDYNARVEHIRQYINNNTVQCYPLIDQVTFSYRFTSVL